jgi:hypothetical protein
VMEKGKWMFNPWNQASHEVCELSPTPVSEVCVICQKSKLGLSEILFVST